MKHGGTGADYIKKELEREKKKKLKKKLKKKSIKSKKRKYIHDKDIKKTTTVDNESIIFSSGMHNVIFIENYSSKFKTTGISLLDNGKNSLIS